MRRMGGADAFMLAMETPKAYMHTFKVAILDPTTDPEGWSFEKFEQIFKDSVHLVPFFRWKFAPAPFNINHPLWIEDSGFNLDYHLRHVACPAPGDHRALCKFMSDVYAYQLDRSRPLWELYLIEGLEGGYVAQLTKIHHCAIDGVSGAEILGLLLDVTPCGAVR